MQLELVRSGRGKMQIRPQPAQWPEMTVAANKAANLEKPKEAGTSLRKSP